MNQSITINIDVKEGYELKYNPETRTIEEVKKKPIRSKSWKEFCKNHPSGIEYYIGPAGDIIESEFTERMCPNKVTTREDAEGILALIQLTRLHDEWVGDWTPDWQSNKYKTVIFYRNDTLYIDNIYFSKRFLAFPTKEMAEEFLTCFKNLIQKAKKFI